MRIQWAGLAIVLLSVLVAPFNVLAQGNLLLFPSRLVFEESKRSQEINIANVGKTTETYDISVIDIKMNKDGSFEQVTVPDSGQNFADKYIRFFPRKVTLAPNESQVVKVQVVKSGELVPGEYRSHLYIRAVPEKKPLGEVKHVKDTEEVSVQLVPIFGITIPVIIRVGENNTGLVLSDVVFNLTDKKVPELHMSLVRSGIMSVYGDFKVIHIAPNGIETEVKVIKGVAVYTPNMIRYFTTDLEANKNINYHSGKLAISFIAQKSKKPVKIAEAELVLH